MSKIKTVVTGPRKVFYIDVGEVPPKELNSFMRGVKAAIDSMKKTEEDEEKSN